MEQKQDLKDDLILQTMIKTINDKQERKLKYMVAFLILAIIGLSIFVCLIVVTDVLIGIWCHVTEQYPH